MMWSALVLAVTGCATQKNQPAQTGTRKTMPPAGTTGTGNASTTGTGTPGGTGTAAAQRTGPKSFASFFDRSKLRSQKGLIVVHWQDDKYYFEIPNSLLGKDFLTVTRYVRMSPGAGTYGGEQVNESVLRFER